jgi:phosphatidylglycerol:prolipoprotein diacylglycerol transferase
MIDINIDPNLLTADLFYRLVISWHGFFSFVAVGSAVLLVGRWAPLRGIEPDAIYSIAIWAILGGVIGARLVHVIDNWGDIYSKDPSQIFNIASGGIALWGGILGGFATGAVYSLITRHPVGAVADLAAPALLYVQTIGRLGDIVNGEHCAKVTDFFLGFMWTHDRAGSLSCANGFSTAVQPVIAYEMAWNMLSLAIIWRLRGRLKPEGMLFALYLALYSVGRFTVSFLREDRIWALGMQEAHYIALLVLVITVPLLAIKARFTDGLELAPAEVLRGTRAERRRRRR